MPWLLLLLPFFQPLSPPFPPSPVMLLPLAHAPESIRSLLPRVLRGLNALFPPSSTLITLGEKGEIPSPLPVEGEAVDNEGLGLSSPRMSMTQQWSPRALTFDDEQEDGDKARSGEEKHVGSDREEKRLGGGDVGWAEGDREELEKVLDLDEHALHPQGLKTNGSGAGDPGLRPPPLDVTLGDNAGLRGEADQETRRREEVVEVSRKKGLTAVLDRCIIVPLARLIGCCVSCTRWCPGVAETRRNIDR